MSRLTEYRVVVAEDDDDLRELIQESLEEEGCTVIPLEDGLELVDYLQLAQRDRTIAEPDLILTDLCMPGKTGLEALAEVRRAQVHCPIVLISAFASPEARKEAFELGVTLCLDKPIDAAQLVSVVEGLVPMSKKPVEPAPQLS